MYESIVLYQVSRSIWEYIASISLYLTVYLYERLRIERIGYRIRIGIAIKIKCTRVNEWF